MNLKKVGIWSSSSPSDETLVKKGLVKLRELGFEGVISKKQSAMLAKKNSYYRLKYLAGQDQVKVSAFMDLYRDSEISDIMAVRGGYGTLRLLSYLDREKFSPNRKLRICGFSDITCIQNYFYKRFAWPWIHGPMLTSPSLAFANKNEQTALLSDGDTETRALKLFDGGDGQSPQGVLIGGNLMCFCSMLGTKWHPLPKKNFILFFEETNEKAYRIDRLLHQLSGCPEWKFCQAIVIGHMTECPLWQKTVLDWSHRQPNLAVFTGLKSGHKRPMLALSMGERVKISKKKPNRWSLEVPKAAFGC